jgi:hypothetical protein
MKAPQVRQFRIPRVNEEILFGSLYACGYRNSTITVGKYVVTLDRSSWEDKSAGCDFSCETSSSYVQTVQKRLLLLS